MQRLSGRGRRDFRLRRRAGGGAAWRRDPGYLMGLAMLVLQGPCGREPTGELGRDARHHVRVGSRGIDLAVAGKAHHALRVVDAVTYQVAKAIDIIDHHCGPEMDAGAKFVIGTRLCSKFEEPVGCQQRVFRMVEEGDCGAVPGIKNYPARGGDRLQGHGQLRVESPLDGNLIADGPLGVANDVQKKHADNLGLLVYGFQF